MPELPEVEAVRRVLQPQLAGRTITAVTMYRPDIIKHPLPQDFAGAVRGASIADMGRRGKYLWLSLTNGSRVVLHLRMTGCLLVTPPDYPMEKHTHLVFSLDNGGELRFTDLRRFGRFWLLREGEADTCTGIAKLGPEPFDEAFSAQYLMRRLGKSRRSIKACLLDQEIVAGIGNIYSDEILHAAKIYPARPAASLNDGEWHLLEQAIPSVLGEMMERNRMTPEEYLLGKGREYRNTPSFLVYGRENKPCTACSAALERRIIGGRSSCFCPRCQPESGQ